MYMGFVKKGVWSVQYGGWRLLGVLLPVGLWCFMLLRCFFWRNILFGGIKVILFSASVGASVCWLGSDELYVVIAFYCLLVGG